MIRVARWIEWSFIVAMGAFILLVWLAGRFHWNWMYGVTIVALWLALVCIPLGVLWLAGRTIYRKAMRNRNESKG